MSQTEDYGLQFFVISIVIGIFCRKYLSATSIPYTVLLLLIGGLLGVLYYVWEGAPFHYSFHLWSEIHPEVLLFTILPLLIFESSFASNVHVFMKLIGKALVLAGPGVIVATTLTACFLKYILPYDWDWNTSITVGAMLSATDPVAVVSLLKEIGASEKLSTLIEGESLLNDGTSIVIFSVFLDAAAGGHEVDPKSALLKAARLSLGGPLVGMMIGGLAAAIVGQFINDSLAEVSVTMVTCYGAFVLAEGTSLHVSGVLAVVFAGLLTNYYGRGRFSPSIEHTMHSFWSLLGYLANTVVFLLSGYLIGEAVLTKGTTGWIDWGVLFFLYLGIHVVRVATISLFAPFLALGEKYKITFREAIIISYSGLRGAVGLILALIFYEKENIDEETRDQVLFLIAGIAALTIIINGSTTKSLIHFLGLDRTTIAETEMFVRSCSAIEARMEHVYSQLRSDRFVADADWNVVWRYIPVPSAKVYWHRIRMGHITICSQERILLLEPRNDRSQNLTEKSNSQSLKEVAQVLPQEANPSESCDKSHKIEAHQDGEKPQSSETRAQSKLEKWGGNLKQVQSLFQQCFGKKIRTSKCKHLQNPLRKRWGVYHDIFRLPPRIAKSVLETVEMDKMHRMLNDVEIEGAECQDHDTKGEKATSVFDFNHPNLKDVEALEEKRSRLEGDLYAVTEELMDAQDFNKREIWNLETEDIEGADELLGCLTVENCKYIRKMVEEPSPWEKTTCTKRTESSSKDTLREARHRFLQVVKGNYLSRFQSGWLESSVLRVLCESSDEQLDLGNNCLGEWDRIAKHYTLSERSLRLTSQIPNVPIVTTFLKRIMYKKLIYIFELASSFIKAREDIEIMELVEDGPIAYELAFESMSEIQKARETLKSHLPVFPELSRALKTYQSARIMLSIHSKILEEFREEGYLNDREYDLLRRENEASQMLLKRHPHIEAFPAREQLLENISFLKLMSKEEIRGLSQDVGREEFHGSNVELLMDNDHTVSQREFYVILRGSVHRYRVEDNQGMDETIQSPCEKNNALDSSNFQRRKAIQGNNPCPTDEKGVSYEVLPAGSTFGFISSMLHKRSKFKFVTSSFTHLYYFNTEDLLKEARSNPRLNKGLWRSVLTSLLRSDPPFSLLPATVYYETITRATFFDLAAPSKHAKQKTNSLESAKGLPRRKQPVSPMSRSLSHRVLLLFSHARDDQKPGVLVKGEFSQKTIEKGSYIYLLQGSASPLRKHLDEDTQQAEFEEGTKNEDSSSVETEYIWKHQGPCLVEEANGSRYRFTNDAVFFIFFSSVMARVKQVVETEPGSDTSSTPRMNSSLRIDIDVPELRHNSRSIRRLSSDNFSMNVANKEYRGRLQRNMSLASKANHRIMPSLLPNREISLKNRT